MEKRKIDYSGYSLAAEENENKLVDNKKLCPFNCVPNRSIQMSSDIWSKNSTTTHGQTDNYIENSDNDIFGTMVYVSSKMNEIDGRHTSLGVHNV